MPDDMSPSIAPEPGKTGFDVKGWASKNWWLLLLAGAVVIFLLYTFRKTATTSGSGVMDSSGAVTSDGSSGVSATQPDQSNVIGMISTQFQALMNQLQNQAQQGATSKPPSAPAPKPAPRPKPHPLPPVQVKPHPAPRPTPSRPKPPVKIVPSKVAAVKPAASTAAPANRRAGLQMGGANPFGIGGPGLAYGGVPTEGAAVPFGTYVQTHDPLRHNGMMYANDRAV